MLSSLLTERWVYLLFSLCQMPRLTKDTSPPEWKGLLTLPWIIEKRTMHAKFRSPVVLVLQQVWRLLLREPVRMRML